MMYRISILLVCILLAGCANPTKKRFPSLPERLSQLEKKDIDLFVDVMILSDIRGKEHGVDEDANRNAQNIISEALSTSLIRRGYKPNIVYLGPALTYKKLKDEKVNLLKAENWKPTGDEYTGPAENDDNKFVYSESLTAYLDAMLLEARSINNEEAIAKNGAQDDPDSATSAVTTSFNEKTDDLEKLLAENPELLSKLQSDILLYVSVTGLKVSVGKQIGLGALSSGLGIVVGGAAIALSGQYTPQGTTHEYALFHRPSSEIIWHYLPTMGPRLDYVAETVEKHIQYLPGSSGEYIAAKPPVVD